MCAAFKSSWDVPIYELGGRNYDVMCIFGRNKMDALSDFIFMSLLQFIKTESSLALTHQNEEEIVH